MGQSCERTMYVYLLRSIIFYFGHVLVWSLTMINMFCTSIVVVVVNNEVLEFASSLVIL